ncbi:MAG TPA: hypothetical protein V6D11_20435 [Waterburya sp.]|jgi:hypothetical protein
MSDYFPFCPHRPCPICGDTSGDCSINEYGYAIFCRGACEPEAKEGELRGFWKCFRSNEEYSQWEDQRVQLENQIKPRKVTITNPDFFSQVIERIERAVKRNIEKNGGEG